MTIADETYPARKGAKKDLYEENMRRKQEGETPKTWPEGFTIGSSYLTQLGCFAGLQCRNTAFARALALALVFPLRGVDYWLTDDNDSYNDILSDRVKCLVHKLRTRARSDERVSELHEAGKLDELQEYLKEEYETAYDEIVATLREEHPSFWDEDKEEFNGPVSTNAIEGGNWRLKYGLGVPYARCRAARARVHRCWHCVNRYRRSQTASRRRALLTATARSPSSRCWGTPQHSRYRSERKTKRLRQRHKGQNVEAEDTSVFHPSTLHHRIEPPESLLYGVWSDSMI